MHVTLCDKWIKDALRAEINAIDLYLPRATALHCPFHYIKKGFLKHLILILVPLQNILSINRYDFENTFHLKKDGIVFFRSFKVQRYL